MTAKSLTSLVTLVVGALNKGETILPQSTYISMVKTEVHQIREKLGENMSAFRAMPQVPNPLAAMPQGQDPDFADRPGVGGEPRCYSF